MATHPYSAQCPDIRFGLPTTSHDIVRLFLRDGSWIDVRCYDRGKPDMLDIVHTPEHVETELLLRAYGMRVGLRRKLSPQDTNDLSFKISRRTKIGGQLIFGCWYKKHWLEEFRVDLPVVAAHYEHSQSLVQCSTLGVTPAQYS